MDTETKTTGVTEVSQGDDNGQRAMKTGVRRIFSFAQMFFFALQYMSSWEALATNIGLVFYNGGPRAVVWGFFIIIPGVLCQVASFAEMSSVQPIAGAQYHWTWKFAPPRYRRFLTWILGWITWFSWISLLAGVVNVAANVTTVIVSTSYPSYVPKGWHTVLIMYAYSIVLGLINSHMFWIVPYAEVASGILHIVLWIVFAAVLLALTPKKHTNDFVWLSKSNLSGWQNDFVSFNLGILLITWGFVGFDATAHISEETRGARSAIPRAMFWSICMNSALAFVMVLIFLYCLGPVDDVLNSAYPLVVICANATRSATGAAAMVGVYLIVNICVTVGSVTSASRLTWAWARDGGLPSYFAYVNPRTHVPMRSVWLPTVLVMLLSLLNLANYTAFSVIIALCTFGLYQSYFIVIACVLHARLTNRIDAPWSLGRWGIVVNAFAMVYSAWVGLFMIFPNYLPITAAYMNYALPINAFVWIVAIVLWFVWGRTRWKGLDEMIVEKVVTDGDRDTKD